MNGDGFIDVDSDGNEILYGEYDDCDISRTINTTSIEPLEKEQRTTFNGVSALNANKITNLDELKASGKLKKENSVLLRDLMYDSEQPHLVSMPNHRPICTVKKGEPKRIVVTIYVEGWDDRMTDAIDNASFDISLSFLALFDQ